MTDERTKTSKAKRKKYSQSKDYFEENAIMVGMDDDSISSLFISKEDFFLKLNLREVKFLGNYISLKINFSLFKYVSIPKNPKLFIIKV